MWAWLIAGCIAVLVLLAVIAGFASFVSNNEKKRGAARAMFKDALVAVMGATGVGGLILVVLLLHQANLL